MTKVTLLLCLCLGLGSADGACTEEACVQSDPSVQWSSVLLQRKHIVQPQGDIALAEEEIATSELQGDQAAALSEEKAGTDELQARWAANDVIARRVRAKASAQAKHSRKIRQSLRRLSREEQETKKRATMSSARAAEKHHKKALKGAKKHAEAQHRRALKGAKKQTKKQTKTTRTRTAKTPAPPPPPRVPTTCRCLQCGGAHGPWQSGSCVAQASEVGKSCISNAGHGGCVSSLSDYSCNCPGTVGDRYDV